MFNCCENRNNCGCLALITTIVAGLFLAALGLILGAVFGEFLTTILAPLVILAIVFFVMAVVLFIYKLCTCSNN